MKNWFNRNYRTLIISTFLIPIITVAVVSISHVTKWYGISNPFIWAAYLSIGIEIAALSALAAISANMGKNVYFPFGIVTLIQFIGNIYYTYFFIEIDSKSFISWVELVSPLIEFIGVESTDLVGHKRFLAVFSGGMLPLISLSFLHMLVKFTEEDRLKFTNKSKEQNDILPKEETNVIESKELISEVSRIRLSQEELDYLEKILTKKEKSISNEEIETQEEEISNGEVETQEEEIETQEEEISNEEVEIQEEEIYKDEELEESDFKEKENDLQEELVTTENSDLTVESEEKKKNNI
jgi:hypothetical protein